MVRVLSLSLLVVLVCPAPGWAQITPAGGVQVQNAGVTLGRASTIDCQSGCTFSLIGGIAHLLVSGGSGTVTGSGTTGVLSVWTDGPGGVLGDSIAAADNLCLTIGAQENRVAICGNPANPPDDYVNISADSTVGGDVDLNLSPAGSGQVVVWGPLVVADLAGGGTQMVTTDTSGLLGTQAIPTGTVTAVATSAPITGGPITTTGTVACPTCNAMAGNPYALPASVPATGGLMGGVNIVQGSAGSVNPTSPFGSLANGNALVTPSAAWGRGLAMHWAAAQATGANVVYTLASSTIGQVNNQGLVFISGRPAGVYQASPLARYGAFQAIGAQGTSLGSATPTAMTGWAAELLLDSGGVVLGASGGATIPTSTTTYSGPAQAGNVNTTEATAAGPSPLTGPQTLRHFCFHTNTTQDASGSLVATVMVDGSPTSLTATQAAGVARGYFCDHTNTASVSGTQAVSVRFVNNASAGTTTLLGWSIELLPAAGTPGVVFGGVNAAVSSGATTYYAPFSRTSNATETNVRVPMPRAGTMTTFCVQKSVGATVGTTTATIVKNGSASGQLTMTLNASTGVQCATGSVSWAAGDTMTMEVANTSACSGGCPTLGGWSVEY